MDNKKEKATATHPTVLRLDPQLRLELMRLAAANGRSLSKEIAVRLDASLVLEKKKGVDFVFTRAGETVLIEAKTNQAAYTVTVDATEIERALLSSYRSLPHEKQLALISLLK